MRWNSENNLIWHYPTSIYVVKQNLKHHLWKTEVANISQKRRITTKITQYCPQQIKQIEIKRQK